jgi:adenine-specific DNA-methyltransferase
MSENKLKMRTPSLADANFAALAALFPNAVTETIDENGAVVRAIDAEVLRQEINAHVVEGKEERYQFTWPDKKKSVILANAPIAATLRPYREESVDFDNTENLYTEGDNLDVLKLLRETYLNRIKMIYIDPPYNTGNDFVFNDDFAEDADEFYSRDYQYDDDGNRMVRNLDSNGRFHTDWLNMIYPRLRLARDLLTDDGVIFISIDDNEVENLNKICNEILGNTNYVATFIWEKRTTRENRKVFSVNHDYIVCFAKHKEQFEYARNLLPATDELHERYNNPDNDPRGAWQSVAITAQAGHATPSQFYEIITPSGRTIVPPTGNCWRYTKPRLEELIADNRIYFGANGGNVPRLKMFKSDVVLGLVPHTVWRSDEVSTTDESKRSLIELFDGCTIFDTPKPNKLLDRILRIATDQDSIILDFFSGSATTAHAVMQLNAEDGGKRKFIMVQLPEVADENSEAFKAGYKNICEIGKERIRRAGAKIKSDNPLTTQDLDIGFRVLKLDSSNMQDVYYTPQETMQRDLDLLIDNIKPDRTPEDLLFQVMLDLGIPLSAKIESDGGVFHVNGNYLIACFEKADDALVTAIAKAKPYYAVFRDRSFDSDSILVNFEQIFATYSPTTIRRVL